MSSLITCLCTVLPARPLIHDDSHCRQQCVFGPGFPINRTCATGLTEAAGRSCQTATCLPQQCSRKEVIATR